MAFKTIGGLFHMSTHSSGVCASQECVATRDQNSLLAEYKFGKWRDDQWLELGIFQRQNQQQLRALGELLLEQETIPN
jgi:hypothetical protein